MADTDFIPVLYVEDLAQARDFYAGVFQCDPIIDVDETNGNFVDFHFTPQSCLTLKRRARLADLLPDHQIATGDICCAELYIYLSDAELPEFIARVSKTLVAPFSFAINALRMQTR